MFQKIVEGLSGLLSKETSPSVLSSLVDFKYGKTTGVDDATAIIRTREGKLMFYAPGGGDTTMSHRPVMEASCKDEVKTLLAKAVTAGASKIGIEIRNASSQTFTFGGDEASELLDFLRKNRISETDADNHPKVRGLVYNSEKTYFTASMQAVKEFIAENPGLELGFSCRVRNKEQIAEFKKLLRDI